MIIAPLGLLGPVPAKWLIESDDAYVVQIEPKQAKGFRWLAMVRSRFTALAICRQLRLNASSWTGPPSGHTGTSGVVFS